MADDWKRRSDLKSWAISRTCDALAQDRVGIGLLLTGRADDASPVRVGVLTRRWKGSLRIRSSVDFW